ncbi:isochorismate synthase [Spirulina sp. CS-785/01]|uniref:isochorismate synthase n=1 Tax=Spirulina sp. CS-785/01 TaxID=3021716 RepID=UPI00232D66CB|nr:isochorismate synthase [Spirulina sp. CS-785/01]MDB9314870.1 isochorismate synthase [Spirulina sp. CS-785/01]
MPVLPCHSAVVFADQDLYTSLQEVQETAIRSGCPQIVSISQGIPNIDPLLFLQQHFSANQPYFYWEKQQKGDAIAALGQVQSCTIDGEDRFQRSQDFMNRCFQNVWQFGQLDLPFSGVHCFASFTFRNSPFLLNLDRVNSLFAPATLFLPEVQVSRQDQHSCLVVNCRVDGHSKLSGILQAIERLIHNINNLTQLTLNSPKTHHKIAYQTNPKNDKAFKTAVQSVINLIQDQELQKIVLAYATDVLYPYPLNPIHSLNHLRQNHPDCYVFSLSHGENSQFIGASPERLIYINDGTLETDALAGSAPRGKTPQDDQKLAQQLLNSEKEQREHQAVSDYITTKLSQLGLTPQRETLQLLKLANIQHLWTPITAQLPPQLHPLEIVSQLHPTPAVAGVPTPVACDYIQQYETCDRGLYAAPLGWVDATGNSEFIVGIRSALISGHHARLYGGAGIVAGSDPEKEFAEIQLKLQTMLKALE